LVLKPAGVVVLRHVTAERERVVMIAAGSKRRPGQKLAAAGGMAMGVVRRLGNSYRVVIADRDGAHHECQVPALRTEGHDALGVVCDVTDAEAVARLAAAGGDRAIAHLVGVWPSLGDAWGWTSWAVSPAERAFGFPFTRRRGFSQERLIADKVVEIIEVMIGIFDAWVGSPNGNANWSETADAPPWAPSR
jgi:NAD(P)-dependent dehydrogenase (short-subunit alcohol dehydrogenase family)